MIPQFAEELYEIGELLRENHMPQETINMVLAARCGLPVQEVDTRSLYFKWIEDVETGGAPESLCTESTPIARPLTDTRRVDAGTIRCNGVLWKIPTGFSFDHGEAVDIRLCPWGAELDVQLLQGREGNAQSAYIPMERV